VSAGVSEPWEAAATAPEPELIEVWRLGRAEGPRRHPRGRRPRAAGRPSAAPERSLPAPAADEATATAAAGEPQPQPAETDGTPAREGRRSRRPRPERPDRADRERPERERGERRERRGRPPREDRPDRDPELRAKYFKGRGGRDRPDKAPDPNSPFAKLAALKEQLEANAKERR
jgi:ATP-dependent RNA helicase SUPV3L1/SUV3